MKKATKNCKLRKKELKNPEHEMLELELELELTIDAHKLMNTIALNSESINELGIICIDLPLNEDIKKSILVSIKERGWEEMPISFFLLALTAMKISGKTDLSEIRGLFDDILLNAEPTKLPMLISYNNKFYCGSVPSMMSGLKYVYYGENKHLEHLWH